MRTFALVLAMTFALACPAVAQTPNPDAAPEATSPPAAAPESAAPEPVAPEPGAAPDAGGAAAAPGDQKSQRKEIISHCREGAKSQGLKGPDRKKAVIACVAKQRPGLARRMQCRQDGKAKGLSDDKLKAFVKTCAKANG